MKINQLTTLANTLPFHYRDLLSRTKRLESKHKALVTIFVKEEIKFKKLVDIYIKGGRKLLSKTLKDTANKRDRISFYQISMNDNNFSAYSEKIYNTLADYITSLAEFLEIVRFALSDKIGEKNKSRNLKIFLKNNKDRFPFDTQFFLDFLNKVWDIQKHQTNIKITSFMFENGEINRPKISSKMFPYQDRDIFNFVDLTLNKTIELLSFIKE